MKIDSILRAALRSALPETSRDYTAERKAQAAAAEAMVAKNIKLRRLLEKERKLSHEAATISDTLRLEYGLNRDGNGVKIYDEKAFTKAGGNFPAIVEKITFYEACRRVAAATPEEAIKILKTVGINWEPMPDGNVKKAKPAK